MKRTKDWWNKLTGEEREFVCRYERNQHKSAHYGGYLADDCTECRVCGDAAMHSPCIDCVREYERCIQKALK